MKKRDLISINDLSKEEMENIFQLADQLKQKNKREEAYTPFNGRSMAMIFQKPSLRTRVSFEIGMQELGGHAVYLGPDDIQLGKRETTADIARTLSRYVHIIMARVFGHEIVVELAKYAGVPVINGLSDLSHPCQGLADLFTIYEKRKNLKGLKLAYFGDGNNVAHSLLLGCSKVGMHISLAVPKGYEPNERIVRLSGNNAKISKSKIKITHNPVEAVKGADVIYTDVWASMGQEREKEERAKVMMPYQINSKLLKSAEKDYLVMHCLPAHRGEEITNEVIESPNSVVFDQAENRLHAQKAVICVLLGDNF